MPCYRRGPDIGSPSCEQAPGVFEAKYLPQGSSCNPLLLGIDNPPLTNSPNAVPLKMVMRLCLSGVVGRVFLAVAGFASLGQMGYEVLSFQILAT